MVDNVNLTDSKNSAGPSSAPDIDWREEVRKTLYSMDLPNANLFDSARPDPDLRRRKQCILPGLDIRDGQAVPLKAEDLKKWLEQGRVDGQKGAGTELPSPVKPRDQQGASPRDHLQAAPPSDATPRAGEQSALLPKFFPGINDWAGRLKDLLTPTEVVRVNTSDPLEKVYALKHMTYRSADHDGGDALVRLPKDFDPSKPINIVVYNHGFRDTMNSAYTSQELGRQMDMAPPNTVLVMPEWQKYAGANNAIDGRFSERGRFRFMLQEVLDKTPELAGIKLDKVKNLDIISHSGGDTAVLSEVNNNDLQDKITSITLLDSTYVLGTGIDSWLRSNIKDIASGKKQFRSIYNDTEDNSKGQADRIKQMLKDAGLSQSKLFIDDRCSAPVLTVDDLAKNALAFKYSDAMYNGKGPHTSMPMLYIGPVMGAARELRK